MAHVPADQVNKLRVQLENLKQGLVEQKREAEKLRQGAIHLAVAIRHLARAAGGENHHERQRSDANAT